MHILSLIFLTILFFFSFNIFLSFEFIFGSNKGLYISIISSILLLIFIIYIIYKSILDKKNLKSYYIFLIIFIIYILIYSNIRIESNEKYTFLSSYHEINNNKLTQYTYEEYLDCNNDNLNCSISDLYNKDIYNLELKLNSNNTIIDINNIYKALIEIEKKKKLLLKKESLTTKVNIQFNRDIFFKHFITNIRNNRIDSLNLITRNSFFINKKQFELYTDEYFYFIYTKYLENNIDGMLKPKYSKTSSGLRILINRESIYRMIFSSSFMKENTITIIQIGEKVKKLNEQ